jgi:hypothetical protein
MHFLSVQKLHSILNVSKQLSESRNEGSIKLNVDVANVWKNIQIECIKRVPEEIIKQHIIPEILEQNSLAQSSACRLWRGRLLCAVAARMNPNKYININQNRFINI